MKKILCAIFSIFFITTLHSQLSDTKSMFVEDITGKPFLNLNTEGIEGSPFLSEGWLPGRVTFHDGRTAQIESLRFSPYNNTLYFLRNGQIYEFAEPVKQFEITNNENGVQKKLVFRSGYPSIDKQTTNTFYQVVNDDNTQLLRLVQKTIEEYKPYNQPVVQKFIDREYYYAFTEGKISRVKKRK